MEYQNLAQSWWRVGKPQMLVPLGGQLLSLHGMCFSQVEGISDQKKDMPAAYQEKTKQPPPNTARQDALVDRLSSQSF